MLGEKYEKALKEIEIGLKTKIGELRLKHNTHKELLVAIVYCGVEDELVEPRIEEAIDIVEMIQKRVRERERK